MKKSAKYIILPESRIIIEYYAGKLSIRDALKMKFDEIYDSDYNRDFNIIIDINNLDAIYKSKYVNLILSYVSFLKSNDFIGTIAIIAYTPHQVVFAEILKDLCREQIRIELFYTKKNAIKFLAYSIDDYYKIYDAIDSLNQKVPDSCK